MNEIENEVVSFFKNQGFVIVSSLDTNGKIHNSCKGIVDIQPDGRVYILDLYHGRTYQNLKANNEISITAVDEHNYKGYSLSGKADVVMLDDLDEKIFKIWEKNISKRVSQRVLTNIKLDKKSLHHPEAEFPQPKYLILLKIENIVNLAP